MKMFVLFCSVCIVYNQSINQSIIKFGKVIGIEQPKKKKKTKTTENKDLIQNTKQGHLFSFC